jgi:hypothetical protein
MTCLSCAQPSATPFCDSCAKLEYGELIPLYCRQTRSTNPVEMAQALMGKRSVFTVLELASHFFTAAMRVALTPPRGRVECASSAQNKLCNESDCKFYPAVPPTRMEPRLAVVG